MITKYNWQNPCNITLLLAGADGFDEHGVCPSEHPTKTILNLVLNLVHQQQHHEHAAQLNLVIRVIVSMIHPSTGRGGLINGDLTLVDLLRSTKGPQLKIGYTIWCPRETLQ